MRATRSIWVVATVALATSMIVGVAAVGATEPAAVPSGTVVLYSDGGIGQGFDLQNQEGDEATVSVTRDRLKDADGRPVGRHLCHCMQSDFAWYCSGVIVLVDTALTDAGTILVDGLFKGYNGESLAITGGTGAYAGARGTVKLTIKQGRFARTVKFIP